MKSQTILIFFTLLIFGCQQEHTSAVIGSMTSIDYLKKKFIQ